MASSSSSSVDQVSRRTQILTNHLNQSGFAPYSSSSSSTSLEFSACINFSPPELSERIEFDTKEMRKLLDAHNLEDRDWLYGLMRQSNLFNPRKLGGRVFVWPDYNQSMEQQREMTMKRIGYMIDRGVFEGWLTAQGPEAKLRKLALMEVIGIFDHSLSVKLGVHFMLWGGAIQFFGTKRHHDKWLRATENYAVKGCFAMSELGHGSNVRGIETVTTYDSKTEEFVINTPCESAQKYWIGGAANHATHTVVFSQLNINGKNQGVHAFIAQIRDLDGNICPNIRIADCGHKIGLNGVDNGRIWFDNARIPRENLLNSVADVSPDGQYLSSIKDPDQRFAAFLAPLTSGRVNITVNAVYSAKISLAIAIRYALTRRAFSVAPNEPEMLLLDYPSHQRRLLPLLAKTYAMSFAANYLKFLYVNRTPELNKAIHVVSSAFKAATTWHNMKTLQECREACGGQGLKTENRIGHMKAEYDVQSTFEGDNNVLMQQISKALFGEYIAAKKGNKLFKGLGLEHLNKSCPVTASQLTSSTLRCSQFQTDVFCLRERDLLNRFVAEVSEHQAQGKNKEYAFILSYQIAQDLGRAFSDRAILQTFTEAERALTGGPLKEILGHVRSMYALITLEEDSSFLRYGYLSTDHVAAVRKEVTKLCSELRSHALALVDSFGIPDAFLSPIAFNWLESNSWSSVQQQLGGTTFASAI
ncbi:Acyl-CoA oxidase/dehydrogenase, middle domain [Dillenia turbinata]|uniref:Acyl-coenzyme A oxidase n=1 Tax=Dillenia turbinata TaxID=194707 RepID=A0AAN8Z3U0_9MAGN